MDAHKNFPRSLVATAPSPATSGTTLVVTTGEGAKFPTAPFNLIISPTNTVPTSANSEIVRVTAISTDTLTITRTQESTSARTVVVGDIVTAGITKKWFDDIEGAISNVNNTADTAKPIAGDVTGTLGTSVLAGSAAVETVIRSQSVDQLAPPASNTNWNGQRILNVGDAQSAGDGVSRGFGDARFARIPTVTTVADADKTAAATDRIIGYTSITANRTVTLPAASAMTAGDTLTVCDLSGSSGTGTTVITLQRAGSDTINGLTSWAFYASYGSITVISDGVSKWAIRAIATLPWTPGQGGTGAATVAGARASAGLNIESLTTVADTAKTAAVTDRLIGYTSLTANRVVTLPAASAMNPGQAITVCDLSGNCGTWLITIQRAGSDTIDGGSGGTSYALLAAYASITLISDGTSKWNVQAIAALPWNPGQGGTGATTLTGLVKGNGTSTMTAVTAPSGAVVGTTDTQTLTNKTLNAPVLSSPTGLVAADIPAIAESGVTNLTTDLAAKLAVGAGATINRQVFAASGTYTLPAGALLVFGRVVGPGAGGGAGRRGAASSARFGGGGGAAGGVTDFQVRASDIGTTGSTVAVTIGTKGTGGAAQTVDSTDGAVGVDGSGNSSFGAFAVAGPGGHGLGGTAAAGTGGTGTSTSGHTAQVLATVLLVTPAGGSSSTSATASAGAGGASGSCPGGGGAGGGIDASNVRRDGGAGGVSGPSNTGAGTAGTGAGASGGAATAVTVDSDNGGGGGGGAAGTSTGGAGNNGVRGGGGGGGGAGVNGSNSGKGGDGGDGYCVVYTVVTG